MHGLYTRLSLLIDSYSVAHISDVVPEQFTFLWANFQTIFSDSPKYTDQVLFMSSFIWTEQNDVIMVCNAEISTVRDST